MPISKEFVFDIPVKGLLTFRWLCLLKEMTWYCGFREKRSWFFVTGAMTLLFNLQHFWKHCLFHNSTIVFVPVFVSVCDFVFFCLSSIITKAHKDKVAPDARSVGQQWLIGFPLFPICRWSVVRMLTNQLVDKETDKGWTQSHNPSDLPTRLGKSCFKTGSYRRRPFVGRERITVGWFFKFMTTLWYFRM